MKNVNWLAILTVALLLAAGSLAWLSGSYETAAIVAALMGIGFALLVVADDREP